MLPTGCHGVQHPLNYAEFLIVLKEIKNQSQHALVFTLGIAWKLENCTCTYKLVLLLQLWLGPVNESCVLHLHFTFALYLTVSGKCVGGLCVFVCVMLALLPALCIKVGCLTKQKPYNARRLSGFSLSAEAKCFLATSRLSTVPCV